MHIKDSTIEQIAEAEAQDYEEICSAEFNYDKNDLIYELVIAFEIVAVVITIITVSILLFN